MRLKKLSFISLICLTTMTSAWAQLETSFRPLTDEEALEEGMTPVEEVTLQKMKSVVTPALSKAGVLAAAKSHRFLIAINKAASGVDAQTLTIFENGIQILKEKVSTGKEVMVTSTSGRSYLTTTPKGFFRPTKLYKDYLSYTWNAPMPNPVFFIGGIAIHATGESNYTMLGKRASGGCVRVTLDASKKIREMVMNTGMGSQPGQYKLITEAKGRTRILNNTVSVDQIGRNTGDIINGKVDSWDTVIAVYE